MILSNASTGNAPSAKTAAACAPSVPSMLLTNGAPIITVIIADRMTASSNGSWPQRTTFQRKRPPTTLMPMSVRTMARPRAIQCVSVSGRSTCPGFAGDANGPFMLRLRSGLDALLQRKGRGMPRPASDRPRKDGAGYRLRVPIRNEPPAKACRPHTAPPRLILVTSLMARTRERVEINLCLGGPELSAAPGRWRGERLPLQAPPPAPSPPPSARCAHA